MRAVGLRTQDDRNAEAGHSEGITMNPYGVLGVATDADQRAIKRAYRLAAMTAHPDKKGGTREAMDRVQLAHDVLMDPDRRARFDRTGEIGESNPDNSDAEAMQIVASLAIQTIERAGATLHRCDFIELIRSQIADRIIATERDLGAARSKVKRYRDMAGRIKCEGAESFLAKSLQKVADDIEKALKGGEHALANHRRAMDLLVNHTFNVDEPSYAFAGATSTTGAWRSGIIP